MLEITAGEQKVVEEIIAKRLLGAVHKKANIGTFLGRPGGNAHVADELVRIPICELGPQLRDKVFVRGAIRHIDHKTVYFHNWREVVKNREGATGTATASGVFWVD